MKAFRIGLMSAAIFLALPFVLHAQSGCSDSPEAPTDVLMLVGTIGMVYGSSVVMKMVRKIQKI